jgi:hypothetical protein
LLVVGFVAIARPLAAQDSAVAAGGEDAASPPPEYVVSRQPIPSTITPSTPFGVPEPVAITGVAPAPCVRRSAVVTLTGRRFGVTQGDREVRLNDSSAVALSVRSWSDDRITAVLPASVKPGGSYGLGLKSSEGTWISNVDQRVTVCP